MTKKKTAKKATKSSAPEATFAPVQAGRPRAPNGAHAIQYSYEGILLVGFTESNQQGDVNSGGAPRIDPVTGHARLGATALPRKIRNIWSQEGREIMYRRDEYMIRDDGETLTIDDMVQSVREEQGDGLSKAYVESRFGKGSKGGNDTLTADGSHRLRRGNIDKYYDLRFFGGLLNVGSDKLDNIRGAVRIQTARSVSPVMPIQDALTRGMITSEKERSSRGRVIGNRTTIPYALFPIPFSVIQPYAREVDFGSEHLRELMRGMIYAFANDQSPTRRGIVHGLWVFQSPNHLIKRPLGRDWLGSVVRIEPKVSDPVEIRSIVDYEVTVDTSVLPTGVKMFDLEMIDRLVESQADFDKVFGEGRAAGAREAAE